MQTDILLAVLSAPFLLWKLVQAPSFSQFTVYELAEGQCKTGLEDSYIEYVPLAHSWFDWYWNALHLPLIVWLVLLAKQNWVLVSLYFPVKIKLCWAQYWVHKPVRYINFISSH